MSFIMIYWIAAAFFIAIMHPYLRNWRESYLRKRYQSEAAFLMDELVKKDDEMENLFVQMLQWREYTGEYRKIVHSLLPLVKNNHITETVAELDQGFDRLHQITETDGEKYMARLAQADDYAAYKRVVDRIANRLSGKDIGMKAEETPILNKNRDN